MKKEGKYKFAVGVLIIVFLFSSICFVSFSLVSAEKNNIKDSNSIPIEKESPSFLVSISNVVKKVLSWDWLINPEKPTPALPIPEVCINEKDDTKKCGEIIDSKGNTFYCGDCSEDEICFAHLCIECIDTNDCKGPLICSSEYKCRLSGNLFDDKPDCKINDECKIYDYEKKKCDEANPNSIKLIPITFDCAVEGLCIPHKIFEKEEKFEPCKQGEKCEEGECVLEDEEEEVNEDEACITVKTLETCWETDYDGNIDESTESVTTSLEYKKCECECNYCEEKFDGKPVFEKKQGLVNGIEEYQLKSLPNTNQKIKLDFTNTLLDYKLDIKIYDITGEDSEKELGLVSIAPNSKQTFEQVIAVGDEKGIVTFRTESIYTPIHRGDSISAPETKIIIHVISADKNDCVPKKECEREENNKEKENNEEKDLSCDSCPDEKDDSCEAKIKEVCGTILEPKGTKGIIIPVIQNNNIITPNFIVKTSDLQVFGKKAALALEYYRCAEAVESTGHPLGYDKETAIYGKDWSKRANVNIIVGLNLGAGGSTTFMFDNGEAFGWNMNIQGSEERLFDSVIPHEVQHMISASVFRAPLPRWIEEGLSTSTESCSERNKYNNGLIEFLQTGRGISFNKMFAMKDYPTDILPLYAQGMAVTEYLIGLGGGGCKGKQKLFEVAKIAVDNGNTKEAWENAIVKGYVFDNLGDAQAEWIGWLTGTRCSHPSS